MSDPIRPKKSFGQHFLRDEKYCRKIVAWAGVQADDIVLEIGAGTGNLTAHLLSTGARVVAVEIDLDLFDYLNREWLPGFRNQLTIIRQDILRLSWNELPELRSCKIIGNLPYNIATRVIRETVPHKNRFQSATFMVQKEVADRILASPGTKDYGYFTVLMDLHFQRLQGFDVPPGAFAPPPKVMSHVLKLVPRHCDLSDQELAVFERLLKQSFRNRRKTLLNNIKSLFNSPVRAAAAIRSCGIEPETRADRLTLQQFLCLSQVL